MATIRNLIKNYKSKYGLNIKDSPISKDLEEAKKKRTKVSLDEWLFRCVCNRNRHQWCLNTNCVNAAVNKLKGKVGKLESSPDFEVLYDSIYDLIGRGNTGISYSTVYDTAIRFGYSIIPVVKPDKYVYVHRHLIHVASLLLGKGHIENRCRIQHTIFIKAYKDFEQLESLEIEDFLCIYADELETLLAAAPSNKTKNKSRRRVCGMR